MSGHMAFKNFRIFDLHQDVLLHFSLRDTGESADYDHRA
jgi:hypothetical protein